MSLLLANLGLISLPAANRQITTLTALYGDAQRSLESLLAEASRLPRSPDRQGVKDEIASHVSLLATFQKSDHLRAMFWGWYVTYSTIKTLFVTLFTLGVGFWIVLRGVGITYTSQSVCPLR
jgi:hypothetical protein